jgi:hypothetical protein
MRYQSAIRSWHSAVACCLLPAACCLLLLLLGCSSSPPTSAPEALEESDGPIWFEDVTDELGLDFVHDPGPTGSYFMPQSMGSGCAFFHDGDGTLCIYLLQNAGPDTKSVNRLYRQQANGKFRDATEGSGLGVAGYNMGVAIADVNNDGLPDVLLTQYGGIRLFLNLGGGRFEDVTAESGLSNLLWGMSAAFLDYDRDGWLDLVVVNYLDYDPKRDCRSPQGLKDFCGPKNFAGTCTKLFRNRGPGPPLPAVGRALQPDRQAGEPDPPKHARVRFEDVSFDSGIGRVRGPGLGVVCADFDGDGWPDIFVANDGQPNRLWMNRTADPKPRDSPTSRVFVDEAVSRNVAYTAMGKSFAGMGVALGDVKNAGMMDLYVAHLTTETNTLWVQGPRGRFRDQTVESGLTATRWRGTGFGALMADFDNDGAVDLAVVNGRVYVGGSARDTGLGFWETYAERNQLFANDGTGKFRDLSPANKPFCGSWNVARGLAQADFNNDGAQDLLVTTIGGRARLFKNVAPDRGHWLKVRALTALGPVSDRAPARDAYGAEVRVRTGDVERLRLINPAESYLSSSSPIAHFGLGKAERFDSILVTWPDGTKEAFPGGAADRSLVLRKGEGRAP